MQKYERVRFKDLKIGDHFTWMYRGIPQHDSFILTGIHDDDSYSFRIYKPSNYRNKTMWNHWLPIGSDHENLIRFIDTSIKLTKEEQIIEKIKYLDNRYKERKIMCS